MSTTTTAVTTTTLVGMLPTMTTGTDVVSEKSCPSCGQEGFLSQDHSADEAQKRIKELEEQVQYLNVQAEKAAEKLASYEDEIRRLRAPSTPKKGSSISSSSSPRSLDKSSSPSQLPSTCSPQSQPQQSRLYNFTSFLPYRRPNTAPPVPPAPQQPLDTVQGDTLELQHALDREQNLRRAAETQLSQASTELEDLTVQLFSQANEMVAQERKARARLEERVAVLERRDVEKRTRLDRLEKSMERVERIRALVG